MTGRRPTDARRAAISALKRRALSRRELLAVLAAKGFTEADAAHAADELERMRALSDRALAESIVQSARRRGLSKGATASRLRERGIPDRIAGDVLEQGPAGAPPDPVELARQRVAAAPRNLGPAGAARRTAAFLARRGFDEDTVRDAVERAVTERYGTFGA